jgi:hypothetical protein
MPFPGSKKKGKDDHAHLAEAGHLQSSTGSSTNGKDHHKGAKESVKAALPPTTPTKASHSDESSGSKPKLVFHCQLAHGSPTGLISGFTNVKELYNKIAECYEIQPTDVSQLFFPQFLLQELAAFLNANELLDELKSKYCIKESFSFKSYFVVFESFNRIRALLGHTGPF